MTDDAGMEDEVKKVYTMPLHLGVFAIINSKRFMNKKFKKEKPISMCNDIPIVNSEPIRSPFH